MAGVAEEREGDEVGGVRVGRGRIGIEVSEEKEREEEEEDEGGDCVVLGGPNSESAKTEIGR